MVKHKSLKCLIKRIGKINLLKWFSMLFAIFAIFAIFALVACQSTNDTEPKSNPILKNPQFIESLSHFNIMLIAPGSASSLERVEALKAIPGLKLVIPENLFSAGIPYSDDGRFQVLKNALTDENSNTIIWALRGGYGTQRLIEKLDKLPKPKNQKIVIGYSDITALHLFLSQKWGWKTIHGPILSELLSEKVDSQNFQKIIDILNESPTLKSNNYRSEINNLYPLNTAAQESISIQGLLTGGNLTMIQNSIGTKWEIETKNKIIFLEDDGEKGYRIDRLLEHLKQAGKFEGVKAVIFGDFTESDEHVEFAINRFSNETSIPIFKTNEFGHGFKNYPLIYNSEATIEKNSEKNQDNVEKNRKKVSETLEKTAEEPINNEQNYRLIMR